MKHKRKAEGYSLVELLVVVAIIGILLGLTMPSFNSMMKSQQITSTKTLIRTALTQAQVYASSNQKYAGLRFQSDTKGRPHIILIENTHDTTYAPIPNARPVALPEGIGLISASIDILAPANRDLYLDDSNNDQYCLLGATTFTIIFSPTGQLVIKTPIVHPRNDFDQTMNVAAVVEAGGARFYCDGWYTDSFGNPPHAPVYYCLSEDSTMGLYIYEKEPMQEANSNLRYTEYVSLLQPLLINTYTGKLIELDDL